MKCNKKRLQKCINSKVQKEDSHILTHKVPDTQKNMHAFSWSCFCKSTELVYCPQMQIFWPCFETLFDSFPLWAGSLIWLYGDTFQHVTIDLLASENFANVLDHINFHWPKSITKACRSTSEGMFQKANNKACKVCGFHFGDQFCIYQHWPKYS